MFFFINFFDTSEILTTNAEANINLPPNSNTNETIEYDISEEKENFTVTTKSITETDTAEIATTDQAVILKDSSNIQEKSSESVSTLSPNPETSSAIDDITTTPANDITTTAVEETTTIGDNSTTTVSSNDNGDDERNGSNKSTISLLSLREKNMSYEI